MLPLSFGWRHLLFANWPVDGDVVAARIPDVLYVDVVTSGSKRY